VVPIKGRLELFELIAAERQIIPQSAEAEELLEDDSFGRGLHCLELSAQQPSEHAPWQQPSTE
jgi:hypothetical protein